MTFPFTAIQGQDAFKKALILVLIDPTLGGVLAVGDRGAGKTTLIRSLADLMTEAQTHFPFINLPIGATEDRLLGHVNVERLINQKQEQILPGLLAQADRGILYVDEINLLNDYLMDVLLDASSSGSYHLEREGLSRRFDSRFILIGSMNPEEGSLRPQLRDRFGLSVAVNASRLPEDRVKIIQNRLAFDQNPGAFISTHRPAQQQLKAQIIKARARNQLEKVKISRQNLDQSVAIALSHQVEGLRADILLVKAARALAAFYNRLEVTEEDLNEVAPLVLHHRSNSPDEPKNKPSPQNNQPQETPQNVIDPNSAPQMEPVKPSTSLSLKGGKVSTGNGTHEDLMVGKTHRSEVPTATEKTDIRKTVTQYVATDRLEIKKKHEAIKACPKVIFLIDSSGSMIKDKAISYVKGLVNKTIQQSCKTSFAIIAIHHSKAQTLLPFSREAHKMEEVLSGLPIGGKTNMVAGFDQLSRLLSPAQRLNTQVFIMTDGRFNTGASGNVLDETVRLGLQQLRGFSSVTVVDSEQGLVRLGLARGFAQKIGAHYQIIERA